MSMHGNVRNIDRASGMRRYVRDESAAYPNHEKKWCVRKLPYADARKSITIMYRRGTRSRWLLRSIPSLTRDVPVQKLCDPSDPY